MLDEHSKVTQGGHTLITVQDLHPYTAYVMEVASYYKDQDQGPYSFPQSVITKQAGNWTIQLCKSYSVKNGSLIVLLYMYLYFSIAWQWVILYSYKVSACQFMTQDVLTNLLGIEREKTEKKQTNKQTKEKEIYESINKHKLPTA